MKISDVIGKVLDYHPKFPDDYAGCDGYKSGNPDAECTGVVCALVPTVEVIKKTAELGCNLLYVHEPSFYCSPDYPDWRAGFENRVYEEKKALLDEAGIAIWRDHDHAHAHNPDSIFTGVIKYLGWEKYQAGETVIPNTFASRFFEFEDMTVEKMNEMLKDRLSLNGIRYIGRPEDKIRKVALVGHLFPMSGSEPVTVNGYCPEYSTDIIKDMEEKVEQVEQRSPEILKEYREKLEGKVKELLADTQIEESRIAAEVILFADKICTDEETVRLKSHIHRMAEVLQENEGIGRKLDFIAQEMNREANTILSKANDLETSNLAIDLKTEIEKVREQIQNIE